MDKRIRKTSFCKWIEPASFKYLPADLQRQIAQANAYVKKFDFHSFLKLMFLAVSSQKKVCVILKRGFSTPISNRS